MSSRHWARERMVGLLGGPARARLILLFACVLGLSSADTATVGAVAGELEPALGIGNAQLGVLGASSLVVGAAAVLPIGWLVDRTSRVPVLAGSIVLWSAAMIAGGAAGSYSELLLSRLVLGGVAATAGPAIASLTGDYFPARERGRVYGYILSGEILGTAVGFLASGSLAGALSWRFAFWLLSVPGFALAWFVYRLVPEPLRGGQSQMFPGVQDVNAAARGELDRAEGFDPSSDLGTDDPASEAVLERGVAPRPAAMLNTDPRDMSLYRAVRIILAIPTNLRLIAASSLGYFFFAGVSTFAVVFVRGHYGVGQTEATGILGLLIVGGFVGVLISGRIADRLLRAGLLNARIWVPVVCYLTAVGLLVPAFIGRSVIPWVGFAAAGAGAITAASPPLDAARLDIVPSWLWGRAESVRTLVRDLAQAAGPLLFGVLSVLFVGTQAQTAPSGKAPATPSASAAHGLQLTFLVTLVALAAAGILLLRARHTYARDVATALASEKRQASRR